MKICNNLNKNIELPLLVAVVAAEYLLLLLLAFAGVYAVIPFFAVLMLFFLEKRASWDFIAADVFFVIICFLVVVCGKEFVFFPQAKDLLDVNESLLFWFGNGHLHAVRLLIAYPGFLISEACGIELNAGFSYYCIAVFTLLYRSGLTIQKLIFAHRDLRLTDYALSMAYFLLLAVAMNGRIIFAFLGVSLILICNIRLWRGEKFAFSYVAQYAAGLLLTTVSSGTLVVGCGITAAGVLLSGQTAKIFKNYKIWVSLAVTSPVVYVFIKYVAAMIRKNVDYFGGGFGGIINMLTHGMGKFLPVDGASSLIFIGIDALAAAAVVLVLIFFLYRQRHSLLPVISAFIIGIFGSLFGFSTGTTALIPALTLAIYACERLSSRISRLA